MAFVISKKYKFVFVHIPKTGGTSFATLDPKNEGVFFNKFAGKNDLILSHQHIIHAQKELKNDFDSYFKFTIIRNPYHRAVSIFKHFEHLFKWDFGNFIDHLNTVDVFENSIVYWPSWYWIIEANPGLHPYGWGNNILVNKLILFDNINTELPKLLNTFGIECDKLPHNRNSEIKDYESYYTDRLYRKTIKNVYEKDFDLYWALLNNRRSI